MGKSPEFSRPDRTPELREVIQLAKPKPKVEFQISATDGLYTVESLALRSASEQRVLREILGLPPFRNVSYLPENNHGESK